MNRLCAGDSKFGGQVHAVLKESGRRMNERIGPLNPELGREPRPSEYPQLRPGGWGEIVFCREMLGQSRQQGVPAFVTDRTRIVQEQSGLLVL